MSAMPSPIVQRQIIDSAYKEPYKSICYLISSSWWQSYKDATESGLEKPGPINNFSLV
jgi:hypothetical protein